MYFGIEDKGLADGIFARINAPFIVPHSYMHRILTPMENRYNILQQCDRALVEHFFSRLKGKFRIVDEFTFKKDSINYIFISCLTLTNVTIMYQDPLRRY